MGAQGISQLRCLVFKIARKEAEFVGGMGKREKKSALIFLGTICRCSSFCGSVILALG